MPDSPMGRCVEIIQGRIKDPGFEARFREHMESAGLGEYVPEAVARAKERQEAQDRLNQQLEEDVEAVRTALNWLV